MENIPTAIAVPATNPHKLWRQLLGFVFWTALFSLPTGGPVGMVLCLLLGGATFTDAWISGIYKRPDSKSFVNISPMGWGIAMALLFLVAYPAYLISRNRLRTVKGSNGFFIATIALGALVIGLLVINVVGLMAAKR